MHILNAQLTYTYGGNPQVCLDYTRMLTSAGNCVTVLLNPKDPFITEHKETGANVIIAKRLGALGPYDLLSVLYFKKILSKVKPDLVVVHEGRLTSLMKMAIGKLDIPLVDVNHFRSPKQSIHTNATIVTNTARLREYKKLLGESRLVYHITNALDAKGSSKPIRKTRNAIPVIGVMSRLVHHKGIDVFIEALAILNQRNIAFYAKIVGDGEERAILEAQIIKHKLTDKVSMPGYEKDLDKFYKSIDIFCLPSRQEEFGLVVLWAYKYGIASVVTNTEGPSDIAENNKDALIVETENPLKLADALQELLLNEDKANAITLKAYEKFIQQYSIPVVANNLNHVLQDIKTRLEKVAA